MRNQKRNGSSQSGRLDDSLAGDRSSTHGGTTSRGSSRPALQLAQRPDPRRTRQLLRQNILASKSQSGPLREVETEELDDRMMPPTAARTRQVLTDDEQNGYEEQEDSTLFSNRHRTRNNRPAQPPMVAPEHYDETGGVEEEGEWNHFDFVDPDDVLGSYAVLFSAGSYDCEHGFVLGSIRRSGRWTRFPSCVTLRSYPRLRGCGTRTIRVHFPLAEISV